MPSPVRRPEVRNQGVGRARLRLKALGKNPFGPLPTPGVYWPSLAFLGLEMHHSGHMTICSLSVFTWHSFCAYLPQRQISPLCKDTSQIR